jgi:hypothetical protein
MLRRACLGPAIPATCTACGGKIGVPMGRSMLAIAPFIGSIIAARFAPTLALALFAWIVGATMMITLHFLLVPLIKR